MKWKRICLRAQWYVTPWGKLVGKRFRKLLSEVEPKAAMEEKGLELGLSNYPLKLSSLVLPSCACMYSLITALETLKLRFNVGQRGSMLPRSFG